MIATMPAILTESIVYNQGRCCCSVEFQERLNLCRSPHGVEVAFCDSGNASHPSGHPHDLHNQRAREGRYRGCSEGVTPAQMSLWALQSQLLAFGRVLKGEAAILLRGDSVG